MTSDRVTPPERASQLQEAVDTIVQGFEFPTAISIGYTAEGGEKRTTFEVRTADGSATYELHFDGRREETEPELVRRE